MLGGDAEAVEACMPVLKTIGKTHVHLGPAGSGQLTKSCNQLIIAATLAGVSEAIALAKSAGVDAYKMREKFCSAARRKASCCRTTRCACSTTNSRPAFAPR